VDKRERMHMLTRLKRWLWKAILPSPINDIIIKESVLDDLYEMARNAHPNEMLAFFASSKGNKNGTVIIDEIHLQAYEASDDSAHVWLSNLPMTTSIIGTVHSHPGGSTRPSDADLQFYSKLGFVHAIIAEPYRQDNIVFYDKRGRRIYPAIVKHITKGI